MKAVNILSAPSSTPLVWGESGFSLSHTESIKPNLRLLIWVWEENTTRGLLVSYPGTFAVPLQPNFAQGFVLSDDMLNGIPLPPPPLPPHVWHKNMSATTGDDILLSPNNAKSSALFSNSVWFYAQRYPAFPHLICSRKKEGRHIGLFRTMLADWAITAISPGWHIGTIICCFVCL